MPLPLPACAAIILRLGGALPPGGAAGPLPSLGQVVLLALALLGIAPGRPVAAEWRGGRLAAIVSETGRLTLRTDPGGSPCQPLAPFSVTMPDGRRIALERLVPEGQDRLIARSADGRLMVRLAVGVASRHLAFRILEVGGVPAAPGTALEFRLDRHSGLRVTELDYMTTVHEGPGGLLVRWDAIWHRTPANPLGGFALFAAADEADGDETLLRIWVEEGLPHPRVPGAWTVDRARAWLAAWQRRFARRGQMILEGDSLDELRAAIPWAERARVQEIYLFTQTWRTDNFWPAGNGHVHVNRRVFPRGEADLQDFADELRSRGMRLNLHYVSGGIGKTDAIRVGTRPDRRLATWVTGTLEVPATAADQVLVFRPSPGATYPPVLPDFFTHQDLRVDDEILTFASVQVATDGTWRLLGCQRGRYTTRAAAHPAQAGAVGLVAAYGENFVPDNDSTLVEEMAGEFAGLINRCHIDHTEFDGAEIHDSQGRWGYRKFATRVYEALDHPVTAHDSGGSVPRAYIEYRFASTARLFRGQCPFTHGNWSAPVQLASPGRPASTLLDAHFVLSQGHLGGSLGLCRPEPMFAVSRRILEAHGLSGALIDALNDWQEVSGRLDDAQRRAIEASLRRPDLGGRMPERSGHAAARLVHVLRRTPAGHDLVPRCVLTRRHGDIPWQQGQEHGAVSPRQYVRPGDELLLENPFAPQTPQVVLRVLWAFDPAGRTVPAEQARGRPAAVPRHQDLFTAGNAGNAGAGPDQAANILLQPAAARLQVSGQARLRTTVADEGSALRLTVGQSEGVDRWETTHLPRWSAGVDMGAARGIGLRVTGDGSGALLVFQIPGRDYVVPIDFTGPRDIQIPHGEVAWAMESWGWRMATKYTDYGRVDWCRLGFGFVPAGAAPSVRVENLQALGEIPAVLRDPVFHIGDGTVAVRGTVASGQILSYAGGDQATVHDGNWHPLATLPVVKSGAVMPTGPAPVSVRVAPGQPAPWLEIQVITDGPAIPVPARQEPGPSRDRTSTAP